MVATLPTEQRVDVASCVYADDMTVTQVFKGGEAPTAAVQKRCEMASEQFIKASLMVGEILPNKDKEVHHAQAADWARGLSGCFEILGAMRQDGEEKEGADQGQKECYERCFLQCEGGSGGGGLPCLSEAWP